MLAVVTAPGARLDAGSVALAIARRWSDAGQSVLFVDADPSGATLAERLGGAVNADYSPAARGLPSLIVAREPLTLGLLADHCYNLDTSSGSLWALFAPHSAAGADRAARWLGERTADLVAVDDQRDVVVSSSLPAGAQPLAPLLWASTVLAIVASADTAESIQGLSRLCRDLKLSDLRCKHRALIVEGDGGIGDDEIAIEAGMRVAGRLPVVDDNRILRAQGGRRDRAFASKIDYIAERLLAITQSAAHQPPTAEPAGSVTGEHHPRMQASGRSGANSTGNGAEVAAPDLAAPDLAAPDLAARVAGAVGDEGRQEAGG